MIDRYKQKENYVTRDPNPIDWINHSNSVILERYKSKIKGDVLDFGCNHGACTFLILKNLSVNFVTGLDLNEEAIKVAEITKQLHYENSNINFVSANILEFETDKIFDTIVSFHTLEHIYPEDTSNVLQKLKKILNVDGYFIISIPYERAYDSPTQHVAYYNEISLSKLFVENGYECIECFYDNQCGLGGILTGVFKRTSS